MKRDRNAKDAKKGPTSQLDKSVPGSPRSLVLLLLLLLEPRETDRLRVPACNRNKAAMNIICNICRQQFFITTKAPQSVPAGSLFARGCHKPTGTDGESCTLYQTRRTQSEQAQQTDGRLLPQFRKGIVARHSSFGPVPPPQCVRFVGPGRRKVLPAGK